MNDDVFKGNWERLKGKVRQMWGKLTDDDVTVVRGRAQELLGKLQERYGYTKERAQAEFDRFMHKEKDSCCGTTTSCASDEESRNRSSHPHA